ncbi:MAG: hypothetical protein RIB60_11270 [Phycisphaerales bacterium]
MFEDDPRDIVRAMVVRVRGGDMAAAKELLNRVLGRPAAAPAPPNDAEERQLRIVFTNVDTPPMESDWGQPARKLDAKASQAAKSTRRGRLYRAAG